MHGRALVDSGPRAASAWAAEAARRRQARRPTCWRRIAPTDRRAARAAAPSVAVRGPAVRPRTRGDWACSYRAAPALGLPLVVGLAASLLLLHGH